MSTETTPATSAPAPAFLPPEGIANELRKILGTANNHFQAATDRCQIIAAEIGGFDGESGLIADVLHLGEELAELRKKVAAVTPKNPR